MWRYGKRSGVGTFYFSNGDVFQGSWRDDLMHGKVSHFLFFYFFYYRAFILFLDLIWQYMHCSLWLALVWSCRVGFIFTLEIGGLQTFGRERPMVKADSIQNQAMCSLAILKMVGDMASSFVLMLMEQGVYPITMQLTYHVSEPT